MNSLSKNSREYLKYVAREELLKTRHFGRKYIADDNTAEALKWTARTVLLEIALDKLNGEEISPENLNGYELRGDKEWKRYSYRENFWLWLI